jgi:hypothetical protein
MIKSFVVFFISLQIHVTFAKVEELKYSDSKFQYFDYKETCTYFKKDSSLVSAQNQLYLDCMGQSVSAQEFCLKKFHGDDNFVRAFLDDEDKKVVCQFASKAELTYNCEKGESKYCKKAERGCDSLRLIFAAHKKLYHAADLDEHIKCFYE